VLRDVDGGLRLLLFFDTRTSSCDAWSTLMYRRRAAMSFALSWCFAGSVPWMTSVVLDVMALLVEATPRVIRYSQTAALSSKPSTWPVMTTCVESTSELGHWDIVASMA